MMDDFGWSNYKSGECFRVTVEALCDGVVIDSRMSMHTELGLALGVIDHYPMGPFVDGAIADLIIYLSPEFEEAKPDSEDPAERARAAMFQAAVGLSNHYNARRRERRKAGGAS